MRREEINEECENKNKKECFCFGVKPQNISNEIAEPLMKYRIHFVCAQIRYEAFKKPRVY